MRIRPAVVEDLGRVKSRIDSFQIPESSEGYPYESSGLINYSKTAEQLLSSINPFFLVAESEIEKRFFGYCLAYENAFFNSHLNDLESEKLKLILKNASIPGRFLYIDHFGVVDDKGIGRGRLAQKILEREIHLSREMGLGSIVVYLRDYPSQNREAIEVVESLGFRKKDPVELSDGTCLTGHRLGLLEEGRKIPVAR